MPYQTGPGQETALLAYLRQLRQEAVDLKADDPWLRTITSQPRKLLWRMERRRIARRLQGGRYLVNLEGPPRRQPAIEALEPLAAEILRRLDHRYFLSWHSALWYYGLIEQHSWTLYVATDARKRPATFGHWAIRFQKLAQARFFGSTLVYDFGEPIWVASVERALLDSLDRPELAAPPPVVINAFKNAWRRGELNPQELVDLTIKFHSPVMARRVGLLMDRFEIPGAERLRGALGSWSPMPFVPGQKATPDATVDKKWRLFYDANLLLAGDSLK